ncbi:hypothetical protein [Botryobacter ruber]|uniref:hypothetical protein n=1 Tax=Botryobacter ruber TaxID=2171629 RepID=UPI001F0BB4D9|nr:hypothetical protein [Botryobacter ruber]
MASRPADKADPLVLRPQSLDFTPKEFYIANVTDERKDRAAVAYLLPEVKMAGQQPGAAQAIDLQGGGQQAIRAFMLESLPRNTQLRPVTIRLKECRVTEIPGATGMVNGRIAIAMAFEYKRGEEVVQLMEYQGGARYVRPASQQAVVEPTLRQALGESLRYLNNWMNQEADTNLKLAKAIRLHIADFAPATEIDTVYYTSTRPLTWNDFKAKPRAGSKFSASIFPGFAYEGRSEVIKGVLHLHLTMKVYMVPENSWTKDTKSAYGLNHEQRHFDVAKLVAERYKQKLQSGIVTLEDYNSIIQYQFIEFYREMNRLQEQYDAETGHGLNTAAQAKWDKKIAAELAQVGVR